MNRTTYNDLVDNYFPKNGEPASQDVFFRTPAELKTELDNIGDRFDILQGIEPDIWDNTYNYKVGDIVKYNTKYYEAINTSTNSIPSALTDWVEITPIANIQEQLTLDDAPTEGSMNPVTSDGIYTAFNDLETSGTVYNATKFNNLSDDQFMRSDENTGTTGTITCHEQQTIISNGVFADYLVLPGEGVSKSIEWGDSGNKLYVLSAASRKVYEFNVSSPYDIKTAVYSNNNIDTQSLTPEDITFKPDGTRMYEIASNIVYEYTISSPWDLSTAHYLGVHVGTYTIANTDIKFKSDGTKMYTTDASDGKIHVYTLDPAWSIASIVHTSDTLAGAPSSINGMHFTSDGSKLYTLHSPVASASNKFESSWWWCDSCNDAGASSVSDSLLHAMLPIVQAAGGTYIEIYYTSGSIRYVRHDATAPFYIQLGESTSNRSTLLTITPGKIFYIYDYSSPYIKDYYGNISGGSWDKPYVYSFIYQTQISHDLNVGGEIWEYNLPNAWDITTAVYFNYITVDDNSIYSVDVDLSGDGSKLYLTDVVSNRLYQYNIDTLWDITTVVWGVEDTYPFNISSEDNGISIILKDNIDNIMSELQFKRNGRVQLNGRDICYDNGHIYEDNGYQRLSSGLLFQWAKISAPGTGRGPSVTGLFPITFPNNVLSAVCSIRSANLSTRETSLLITNLDKSSVTISTYDGGNDYAGGDIYVMALGY